MSLCILEDLLSFNQEKKDESKKALSAVKEKLDAIVSVVPDDKEEAREEQADWCSRWHLTLGEVHVVFTNAKMYGLIPRLDEVLETKMRKANQLFRKWQGEASRRQEIEKEAATARREARQQKDDKRAVKPAGMATDASGTGASETASGSALVMQDDVRMSVSKASKRTRPVVEDDEDEDEDEAIRPAKKMATTTTRPVVTHETPCTACAVRREPCRGPKERTCIRCTKLKAKCSKSSGRGGRGRVDEETDKRGKEKATVRPTRNARVVGRIQLETTDEDGEDDDEDIAKVKTTRIKLFPECSAPSKRVVEVGISALKRLESKILSTQAEIKAAEAGLASLGTKIVDQLDELRAVKAALGVQ